MMGARWSLVLVMGLLLCGATGCDDSGGSGRDDDEDDVFAGCPLTGLTAQVTVGMACNDDCDCAGLKDGYCAAGGICSSVCETHHDCGCAPGMTGDGINAYQCDAACVGMTGTDLYCVRVCDEPSDCDGLECKQIFFEDRGVCN